MPTVVCPAATCRRWRRPVACSHSATTRGVAGRRRCRSAWRRGRVVLAHHQRCLARAGPLRCFTSSHPRTRWGAATPRGHPPAPSLRRQRGDHDGMHSNDRSPQSRGCPSEAVVGLARLPFGTGVAHYDHHRPTPHQPGQLAGRAPVRPTGSGSRTACLFIEPDDAGASSAPATPARHDGRHDHQRRSRRHGLPVACPTSGPNRSGRRWVRFLQIAGGRHGGTAGPHRPAPSVRPVPRADRCGRRLR